MANDVATMATQRRGLRLRETASGALVADRALLEFQSPTAELIARPIPATSRITVWLVFALLASMIVVASVFPIDRVVTSTGRVVSQAANIVVQPLETSIVRQINVHQGQVVHAGDVLAQLDPTFAQADAGNYASQVESLQAEVNRLEAEANDKPYVPGPDAASQLQASIYGHRAADLSLKLENYRQKIVGLQSTVQRALTDVQGYTARLEVAKTLEAKRRELEQLKVGSQLNVLSALDSRLEVSRGLDTARATVASATADLQAMIQERDGYIAQKKAEVSQQLTDQGRKLSEAREQLNKAQLRRRLVEVQAPQDAIVLTEPKVSVGSVMQSGDELFQMVPTDAPLEVEVDVAGRDAGFVHVGDPVSIKFDTFSYALYGYAKGTVHTVSADSFANPQEDRTRLQRPSTREEGPLGPVYYKARISLDEIKLHDLPANFRMTPGMPVSADIKVGKRTVMGYLLGRVIPNVTEGMREP